MNTFVYEEYNIYGYKAYITNNIPTIFSNLLSDACIIKTPSVIPKCILSSIPEYTNMYEYILYDKKQDKLYLARDALKEFINYYLIDDKYIVYDDEESVFLNIKRHNVIKKLNKKNNTDIIIKKNKLYFEFDNIMYRTDLVYNILLSINHLNINNYRKIAEIGTVYKNIVQIDNFNLKETRMLTILYFDTNIETVFDDFFNFFFNIRQDIKITEEKGSKLPSYSKSKYIASIYHNNNNIQIGYLVNRGKYDYNIVKNLSFTRKVNPTGKKRETINPNNRVIYERYPTIAKDIINYIADSDIDISDGHYTMINNQLITITDDMLSIDMQDIAVEKDIYTPDIIEFSINIDILEFII